MLTHLPDVNCVEFQVMGTQVSDRKTRCWSCGSAIQKGIEHFFINFTNRYGGGSHRICPWCAVKRLKDDMRNLKESIPVVERLQKALTQYIQTTEILSNRVLEEL